MKKPIFAITTSLLLSILSCTEKSKTISTDETVTTKTETITKIEYASPIIIDNSDIILYPLNLNHDNDNSYNSRSSGANYWNMIFYNAKSGKSELLTKEKLVINSFNIGNMENGEHVSAVFTDSLIYYEITNSDFDGDKSLTPKDPKNLFISKLDGKSFTQVSPQEYNLINWKIDVKHDLILMDLQNDLNGDKAFNEKDEIVHFIYNLKTGAAAKPVFSDVFKKEIKELAKKTF